jgi:peroxiredoxin/uncharacterized membrane protein YphA (DoxX/SURF4 family)
MTLFLVARVLLAAVFGMAALAKLADRHGTQQMIVDFGLPTRLAALLAWSLVACELGVAVALAVPASARGGGYAALVSLTAFSTVIALNIAQGRRPTCHCFGRLHATEVGWSTVARNALFMAVGGFVAAGGRFMLPFIVLGVVAGSTWLSLELRGHLRMQPGASAPALSPVNQRGETWTLDSLLAEGTPLLLVFSDPSCLACRQLLPKVAMWQDQHAGRLTVVLVSAGSSEHLLVTERRHGIRILIDTDRRVATAYGIKATPSAVLVDAEGKIAATAAVGADDIAGLVELAASRGEDVELGRRVFLSRVALGIAAVTVLPVIAAACGTAKSVGSRVRPKQLEIDKAWLCDQKYALCTEAACVPSKTNPKVSVCLCKVTSGYAVGFKSCDQRAPKGKQLHSNFSLQGVTSSTRVMTCSAEGHWVQCLDVVCELDADHPDQAHCQCVNMNTTNFLTFAGNCDTTTCSSVIWSATTEPFPGGAQYEKGLKQLGIKYEVPKGCPTPNSS